MTSLEPSTISWYLYQQLRGSLRAGKKNKMKHATGLWKIGLLALLKVYYLKHTIRCTYISLRAQNVFQNGL